MEGHYHHQQRATQYRGMNSAAGNNNSDMHSNLTFAQSQFHGDSSMVDSKTTTRVVYESGSNDRRELYGESDNNNVRSCEITGNRLVENSGNFQFNNYGQGKQLRQQLNSFRNGNYVQRNYIYPQQGAQTQARFVRIQGCKMRTQGGGYRNFSQQKQKHSRGRFNAPMKHFNNFNNNVAPRTFEINSESVQIQKDVQQFIAQQRSLHEKMETGRREQEEVAHAGRNICGLKTPEIAEQEVVSHSNGNHRGRRNCVLEGTNSNNEKKAECNKEKLLKPKLEYPKNFNHNLSYEDVTENSNSDENEELVSDLRERLIWKKHCEQFVKREPGEIYSDEDENPGEEEKHQQKKLKLSAHSAKDKEVIVGSGGVSPNRPSSVSNRYGNGLKDEGVKINKTASRVPTATNNQPSHSQYTSPYSCHDDRCQEKSSSFAKRSSSSSSRSRSPDAEKKKRCCSKSIDSLDSPTKFCCTESEVVELRGRIENLKKLLRDSRDKLLESRVVGSKKTRSLKQEVEQLKTKLSDASKKETELKAALKGAESELALKRLELAKMTTLHDVELREKEKFRTDLTLTYQDRLTIEIEKLRALFDIETAKMQVFYVSQNFCYEDGSSVGYMKSVSECDLRNQEPLAGRSSAIQQNVARADLSSATGTTYAHNYFDYAGLYQNRLFKCPSTSVVSNQHILVPNPSATMSSAECASGPIDTGYGLLNMQRRASSSSALNHHE